jgi:hypothetical protein
MGTLPGLRAIVWLRWRLLKNSISGGRKRDALEQVSRAMALMVPIAIASLSLGTFVAVAVIGVLGGRAVASGLVDMASGLFILRIILAVAIFALVAVALATPSQSATAHYTRLLLLPIHRRVLHLVEVAAGLADPWLAIVGAGLLAFSAGLYAGGRPFAAAAGLFASCALVALLVSAGSLAGFLVSWLMRSRRRGELFTLIFVLAFSLVSFIPALASRSFVERPDQDPGKTGQKRQFNLKEFDRSLPAWTRYLPSELYAGIVQDGMRKRGFGVAGGTMILCAQAMVLFLISARVHRQMLNSLESQFGSRRTGPVRGSTPKVPLLSPASSAVPWAQYKGTLRTVRGRLTILLPGPMLGVLTLAFRGFPSETWATTAAEQGYLLLGAATIFTLYSMHAVSMNFFGSDRAGLTLQLLSPVTDRELAWGKVAGFGMVVATGLAVCVVTALGVAPSGPAPYWAATLIGGIATFVLLCPLAIWFSALFPVASDLSKTGAGGNPHPLPMIVGTLCTAAYAMPAAGIIMAAEFYFQSEMMAVPLMLGWLILCVAICVPLVNVTSRTIGMRRENLALVAQGR